MLPVTSVAMNGTRISEHRLQPSRNPPILVPPQTNIWTLLNSRADRALFSISMLFGLLLKCLRTLMRLLYNLLTFSSHNFRCNCSSYGTSCYMSGKGAEWRLDSIYFLHFLLGRKVVGTGISTYTHRVIRTLNCQMKNLLTIKPLNCGTLEYMRKLWQYGTRVNTFCSYRALRIICYCFFCSLEQIG